MEKAICFGWIDSLPRRLDKDRTMLWQAPRKPDSAWSEVNKKRVAKMQEQGLPAPAGLAKVDAAKANGSWDSLNAIEALEMLSDLKQAFSAYVSAEENFTAFPRSIKRGILGWIASAKKPETRAKRIADTARLASENIHANQWR
jgi:uncharacterized protein YdeI (YjbR/CyaY-like superfamily)